MTDGQNMTIPVKKITMPKIMGIVNVTPDSFSDGGQFLDSAAAFRHGLELIEQGADVLDIGGESTRPGADDVSIEDELARVMPVIEKLAAISAVPISIDTRKPQVARRAMEAGATIWNDVTALEYSADSIEVAAALNCDVILMHAQGGPKTMQDKPDYGDVVSEVFSYLAGRLEACLDNGIAREKIMVDPGIGFGKTLEHNLALMAHLGRFSEIGPVLLGASRKRFIGALGEAPDRAAGSLAAAIAGAANGANMVRVHDVGATRQAFRVFQAIQNAR